MSQNQQPLVIKNKSCKRYFIIQNNIKIYFNSDFDSGNLQKVQQISSYIYKLYPGYDKTRNSTDKTFFYFKVSGFKQCTVRFIITKQHLLQKLINDQDVQIEDYRPIYRQCGEDYKPLKNETKIYRNNYDEIQLSFEYSFAEQSWVEFAFSYPYQYEKLQKLIFELSEKYQNHQQIYFHNEVLSYTPEKRKTHLITITQRINCEKDLDDDVQGIFPQKSSRPYRIDKPKVVISGRVHPGQTPGSYCIEGVLKFLLNQKDYRAYLLRKNFHFIIIPMLNPDGVYHGMFRVDMNGDNLNRFYQQCHKKKHPTIWSFRQYLKSIDNVYFYFDFHAHPSKKGFFIYGNAFDQIVHQVEAQTFGKMIESNCPYFQNLDCIFSQKQMNARDKNQPFSKQGCGRVFVHKLFDNIIHSYTVQCGYFTPNKLNPYMTIDHKLVHSGIYGYDSSWEQVSMKQYTPESYMFMGKATLITILDLFHLNPYPRVTLGQYRAVSSIRKVVALRIYHQAQRFRMVDPNCYKKIKQIKQLAQQYYKNRLSKYGLNISQNYGMKSKKRTYSLNARVYIDQKNILSQTKLEKTIIQKQQQISQNQQNIQTYQKNINNQKINIQNNNNSYSLTSNQKQLKYNLKISLSQKKIKKHKNNTQSVPPSCRLQIDLIKIQQYKNKKQLQRQRQRQDKKKKQSTENKIKKIQQKIKDMQTRRQSQETFRITRIGSFLKRQAKKQEDKFLKIRGLVPHKGTGLPVLYKQNYQNEIKELKQNLKFPQIQ